MTVSESVYSEDITVVHIHSLPVLAKYFNLTTSIYIRSKKSSYSGNAFKKCIGTFNHGEMFFNISNLNSKFNSKLFLNSFLIYY